MTTIVVSYCDIYAIFTRAGLNSSMQFMEEKREASDLYGGARLNTPLNPGSSVLRRAVRGNIVSFPSQIPVFLKYPPADVQWRMVLLFFVLGWSSGKIAKRFNAPKHRIQEILNDWSVRALAHGYVQVIDTEGFAACSGVALNYWTNRNSSVAQPCPDAALPVTVCERNLDKERAIHAFA